MFYQSTHNSHNSNNIFLLFDAEDVKSVAWAPKLLKPVYDEKKRFIDPVIPS